MGFFDLSIPYTDLSPPDRSTRAKLVTKALELGYSGVAYNRTIKGVMSDRDRCSIPLLTLSSLLKHSPYLTSSVAFHRDLLGVPRATPFRQYTRLTVCAETPAQAQALNSGNPILKTYNLVAVKPMNQSAFDQACEKLEVDIIAIDFSEKLPFRLKQPMVKAAIERKVCFEITYANLIADVQTRRQVITNAKLLVDWTRGRNLIISSAAPTANEFRGPYDVANLMSLLGLSMERAKAAISRNCRTLISNAVRKKHYYKEAIRVEVLPSGQEVDENKPWSSDSFNWDPISSGEGDLLLDDLAKAFSNASTKASKTVKAINFASVIDSMPSLGFQVNDLISGTNVAVSKPLATRKNIVSAVKLNAQSVATDGVREHPDRLCFSQPDQSVLCEPLERQRFESENPQKLYSSCNTTKAVNNNMEIEDPTITTGVEQKNPDGTDGITTEIHNVQSQKCVIAKASNDVMEIEVPTTTTGAGPTIPAETDGITTEIHDVKSQKSVTAKTSNDAMEIEAPTTTGMEPTNPAETDGITTEIHDVKPQTSVTTKTSNDAMEIEAPTTTGMEPTNPAETDGITTEIHDVKPQKSVTTKTSNDAMEIEAPTTTGMEPTNPDGIDRVATEVHDVHSQRHMTNCELDVVPPHYNITFHSLDIGLGVASNPDSEVQVPTNYQDSDIPAPHNEDANSDKSGDMQSDLIHGILTGKEEKYFPLNSAFDKSILEIEELRESGDDVDVLANQVPVLESNDEMTITDDYSLANHGTQEMTMEEQEHGKAYGELSYPALAQSESGKFRTKRKKPHQLAFIPLKRLLHATPFKKARKSKRRNKMA